MTRRRQRVARVAVTLLALLVLLAAACGGGSTAPDGGSMSTDERIALVRDQRLLVRAGDGEEAELFRAAASNVFVAFPAWSPDGTRIAFVQSTYAITTEGDWGDLISVIDGSGGPPIVVWTHAQRGQQIRGLTWTADGAALIAGVNPPEVPAGAPTAARPGLLRIDLATGRTTLLVDGALEPSLSRDGARMAYLVPGAHDEAAIWVAAHDGSDARALSLPQNLGPPFAPRISPDGASVAFAASTSGAVGAQPATGRQRLARALPFVPTQAEASRARGLHGEPMEVWRIDVATGSVVPLTSFGEDDPRSAWEPDGAALVVLGSGGLYRVAADGSGVERLGDGAVAGQLDVR